MKEDREVLIGCPYMALRLAAFVAVVLWVLYGR
jgi:hypothetical protein